MGFTPFRRFVHGDLYFEDLFKRLFLSKFCFGDISFEDLEDLSSEKMLGDLSFWKFV